VLSCVGADEFDVGPGDLVCTPAGTEHDIVAVYGSDVVLFFIEEAVPGTSTATRPPPGTRCRCGRTQRTLPFGLMFRFF
jgi:quercetin dioxygenase-like cupin family protein